MFCPQCGSQLPEGSRVCASCNHTLKFIPRTPEELDPTTPVSKHKYFLKVAPSEKQLVFFVSLLLGLLCILSVVFSASRAINGSVFKIPVVSFVGMVEGEDFSAYQDLLDEALEEVEDDVDALEDFVEDLLDVSADDLEDELGISAKKFIKLFKPFSLRSMVKIINYLDADEIDEDIKAIKTVVAVVNGIAIFLVVLTGLGIFFGKAWIMIVTYVISFIFVLATGGIFLLILASAAYIATAVLFSKLNLTYKLYLAGFGVN